MQIKLDRQTLLEVLIVLIVINYMVITVILHDFLPLKYSRDLILFFFTFFAIVKRQSCPRYFFLFIIGLFVFLVVGFLGAYSTELGILVIRKYAYPLILLSVLCCYNVVFDLNRFLKFIAGFMAVVAGWGIFQAHILGDSFLRKIGYKVSFSYGYGADMLNDSFYFGGFGIQRVVSTISNSNVCALILGMALIFLILLYDYWHIKRKKLILGIVALGYLLTFSRSNFLAMGVILLIAIWPRLRQKKNILTYVCIAIAVVICVGIYQGEQGFLFKLYTWIDNTLQMKESSAAGRSSRWDVALQGVLENPWGVGFGHVGTIAGSAGVPGFFICENSYLAMALDFGWAGALLFISFFVYLIKKNWSAWKKFKFSSNLIEAKLYLAAASVVIYHSVVMFFSNHIYDMESLSFLFIIVGVALNNLKRMDKAKV